MAKTSQKIGRQLSGPELKQFRHDVSVLKRKGLIPGKEVDARTARPFTVRGNQHLYQIVHQYRDVLSGNAVAVKLPPAAVAEQHKLGHRSVAGRVLIPKSPTEKVTVRKDGSIVTTETESGLRRIDIPRHARESVEAWARRAQKIVDREKGKQKYVGYKFFGHKSFRYSGDSNVEKMMADIRQRYKKRVSEKDLKAQDLFDHLSILTFNRKSEW